MVEQESQSSTPEQGYKVGYRNPPKEHQFKPGHSGNLAGRPKGILSVTTEIKKALMEIPKGKKKAWLRLLVEKILYKAVQQGDPQMIKLICNYIDGMPKQYVGFDLGEMINEIKVEIVGRRDESKLAKHSHLSEELGGVSEERESAGN